MQKRSRIYEVQKGTPLCCEECFVLCTLTRSLTPPAWLARTMEMAILGLFFWGRGGPGLHCMCQPFCTWLAMERPLDGLCFLFFQGKGSSHGTTFRPSPTTIEDVEESKEVEEGGRTRNEGTQTCYTCSNGLSPVCAFLITWQEGLGFCNGVPACRFPGKLIVSLFISTLFYFTMQTTSHDRHRCKRQCEPIFWLVSVTLNIPSKKKY